MGNEALQRRKYVRKLIGFKSRRDKLRSEQALRFRLYEAIMDNPRPKHKRTFVVRHSFLYYDRRNLFLGSRVKEFFR